MATVYSDQGHGVRPPVVFYNRCNEAGAQLKPGDFDWKAIFAQGVRWVHCGGLFAALSPTTAALAAEMMKEAKAAGAVTSFDLNYRAKLWNIQGGNAKAVETIGKIVENVDVLVGNEEDLQMGLGIPGPEVRAKSKLDPSVFFAMMDQVTKKLPTPRSWRRRCARCTRPITIAGARWPGWTGRPTRRRLLNWMWWIALAAGTALRLASSTACWPAKRPRKPSSWAGRTAHC